MFLHIGDSRIVFIKDLIGIFDLKIREKEENKQLLEFMVNKKDFENINSAKSFVVTTDEVYLSSVSSTTLASRLK